MKAVLHDRYGPPEVLRIREVEKPVPKDHEVRIEVRAASVNPLDWRVLLAELVRTGKVTPVIDRRYSLTEVAEAIRYLETHHARGKVMITVRSDARA